MKPTDGNDTPQTGSSATFTFDATCAASYTVSLTVTDADGNTANASSVTIPYDGSPGCCGGSITPFQPDTPTLSIEETDPDQTVVAGSPAHFQVSLSGNMPADGTVELFYNTQNGNAQGGDCPGGVAQAKTDYTSTAGVLTFTYATGYAPQIIPVNTTATSSGGTFSMVATYFLDPSASTVNGAAAIMLSAIATVKGPSIMLTDNAYHQTATNITNTTAKVLVGEQVTLSLQGTSSTQIEWSISGSNVANYTQSLTKTVETPLLGKPTGNQVQFYAIAGGNETIEVTYYVNNKALPPLKATLNVQSPAVNTFVAIPTSDDPAVGVGPNGFEDQKPTLHFGTKASPGETFKTQVVIPSAGQGSIFIVQLINEIADCGPDSGVLSTQGAYVLDDGEETTQFQSPGPAKIRTIYYPDSSIGVKANSTTGFRAKVVDAPYFILNVTKMSYLAVNAAFTDYLMYQPEGASVPVTLQTLSWHWSGAAKPANPLNNSWTPDPARLLVNRYPPATNTMQQGTNKSQLPSSSADLASINEAGRKPANLISGSVEKNNNSPVPGAVVTASWDGHSEACTTDANGFFRFLEPFGKTTVTLTTNGACPCRFR